MKETNYTFFEEYKHLDRLLSDEFSVRSNGVTAYIEEMENTEIFIKLNIPEWDACYKKLKNYRYIRNQLAHSENAFDNEECSLGDVGWIRKFYQQVISVQDPLSKARGLRMERNRTLTENKRQADKVSVDDSGRIKRFKIAMTIYVVVMIIFVCLGICILSNL